VKAVAARLRLSPAMVYKWCQESVHDDPDASGARNPLDRLSELYQVTGSIELVNWLCHEAGGFFVANPNATDATVDTELLRNTQQMVTQFSQLLLTVTRSIENDGLIEPKEADEIRAAWERLKTTAESFTVACERGAFFSDEPVEEA
jgi:hypothetical protein